MLSRLQVLCQHGLIALWTELGELAAVNAYAPVVVRVPEFYLEAGAGKVGLDVDCTLGTAEVSGIALVPAAEILDVGMAGCNICGFRDMGTQAAAKGQGSPQNNHPDQLVESMV